MKSYWFVESTGTNKKGASGEDTSAIAISYQDSYLNCKLSNIKSLIENVVIFSADENENQTDGQGMKFVSVIVKNWRTNMFTAYDVLAFIFVYGTSAFYLQ